MRKAVVVGIDYYKHASPLYGCVSDARSVERVLLKHGNGDPNFEIVPLLGTSPKRSVSRRAFRDAIEELFGGNSAETALLYFAGHGHLEATGGYLLTSDSEGYEGVPLSEIVTLAQKSGAENKIIVLDSCNSGIAGARPSEPNSSELTTGMTILAAATAYQYADEEVDGGGVFTALFVDALEGAAANLVGEITPGSAYAHIDQSLGSWDQRPVFKTNVQAFASLREVDPPIERKDLRQLGKLFPNPDFDFPLDPSFEPAGGKPKIKNTSRFALLQKFNRVHLVVPVEAPHMFYAAMWSKACRLTALGQHYWRLVEKGRI